jgi:hypothetical protein
MRIYCGVDDVVPGGTAASYAPKVGNCKLRITKKQFVKVLKCLVQNTPKSKVL